MTSGKRYWSDGSIVAGQQFEYSFDDIGNRKTAASGGDEWGANLRYQNYSANSLNQYTQRTVPPYVNVLGAATNFATVTVNLQPTYRKGEYFRAELGADNATAPLWFGITNVAVLTNGGGPNIVSTNQGSLLVAKATETFFNDLDGNLTSDSLWTNIWNGENRLIATESASDVPSTGKAKETWSHLPDGRWIERVVSAWNGSAYTNAYTNRFVWDGQVLLAIVDHTNGLVSSFTRGLDLSGSLQGAGGVGGVLAVNIATNGTHFAAFDGNGNLSALVSTTNGAVTANYEYSPFGETLRANGVVAKANPIRFSTQLADDVTGRKKFLHRELTDTGRWPSRDPIAERGGANLYGFVDNSPANRFDPLGLQALPVPVPPGPPIIILPPPTPPVIIPFPTPPPIIRPIGPPQVALCIVVFAGTYYVTSEIAEAAGIHDGLGDLIGDIIAPPLIGGATGTQPGSPFPAGSRDPLTLPRVNPGPCGKCGNGCKPCPPNSPAWEVNEPRHGSSTTHWHWIEYHQLPATYNKPGSKNKPCDCIPMRQSSPTKPPGA